MRTAPDITGPFYTVRWSEDGGVFAATLKRRRYMVREEGPFWRAYRWNRAAEDWDRIGHDTCYPLWAMRQCADDARMRIAVLHDWENAA